MNREVVKRWVEALRSGDYPQTQRKLRDEDGFCCLGVLCDVVSSGVGIDWNQDRYGIWRFDTATGFPPDSVTEHIGVPYAFFDHYSKLNDQQGLSLAQIADQIEKDHLLEDLTPAKKESTVLV